eukprot:TRINITY_DN16646_c0_g1_i9.p1 TRINITY_DN16646_c0_g1~~TRINITY_DN16646_c0_g1_i9.p1  ORF type:complete len:556 (-),score=113.80 TRINITY_DN16646_c0_g1_i9:55-1611(-)
MAKANSSHLPDSEDDTKVWETAPPLGIPLYRRNLRLYSSTLDSKVVSRKEKFESSLVARQEEMQQLMRNISASMSKNPLVRQIQASRAEFRYKNRASLSIDTTLHQHRGHDAVWQPVNGTHHKFFVYSAFYDDREKPLVRIIATTKTKKSEKVWCQLYYEGKEPVLIQAGINVIRENWNLPYSAAFVTCDLFNRSSRQYLRPPKSVSILSKTNWSASNQLPVHYSSSGIHGPSNTSSIGVCVKPIHFKYNKTLEILQFIELNRILGVTRFTLYNNSMSEEVSCLLSDYIKEGVVEVLPWKLDMDSQKEIRTEGLFAALNDCLYRNMNSFKYLMMIDLDELIIPYQNMTLVNMLTDLGTRDLIQAGKAVSPSQVSSYSFQNAFFYLQWTNDPTFLTNPPLTALLKTRRRQKLHPPKQRSKYICLPSSVKEAGNHFIWEFKRGKTLNVPPSYGFLHHYRVCEFGGDDCVKNDFVEDVRIPTTYGLTLLTNVRQRMEQSKCSSSSVTTKTGEGVGEVPILE